MSRWRTQDAVPPGEDTVTALVAVRDDEEGEVYLLGIYMWQGGRWISEDSGRALNDAAYWWRPEEEILREIGA